MSIVKPIKSFAKPIITLMDNDHNALLEKAAPIEITKDGLEEARKIDKELRETLSPLMPAAGLAAPQIGISKKIFIYSWDRSEDNMETAINPTLENIGEKMATKWEACFSTLPDKGPVEAALVSRSDKVLVTYTNLEGKKVKKILEGFAAKVFQHEYDHLEGVVNTRKKGVIEVKNFPSKKEFSEFISNIKKQDKVNYIEPVNAK
ncbi:MAG: hypothetical protein RLZZ59_622 [Pseudomonadota bacterium]